jgi:hypothetical protein
MEILDGKTGVLQNLEQQTLGEVAAVHRNNEHRSSRMGENQV